MGAVQKLAHAAKHVQLEKKQPKQSALLLNAFARLQHSQDAVLFGRYFSFACKTLTHWDAHSLAVFCNAFATVRRRARAHTSANGWQTIAERCVEMLHSANTIELA